MPAPVTGFSGRVVALGSGAGAQHTCAIVEDGPCSAGAAIAPASWATG
jgi:hypothetical protein